jgi:hypothetical protein
MNTEPRKWWRNPRCWISYLVSGIIAIFVAVAARPYWGELEAKIILGATVFILSRTINNNQWINEVPNNLFRAIGSVPERTIERIKGYIDQMRESTYKTWNPVQIIGIEATGAEKGILENPGPNKAK